MPFKTEKLFYAFPHHRRCISEWRPVNLRAVAIARSVAYPEAGGQRGDQGTITQGELVARFVDCQKTVGAGKVVLKPGFPTLNVEGEVHLVLEADLPKAFDPTKPILIEIDAHRRTELTISHSASHLLYLAMTALRPDVPFATHGCSIEPNGGRFDVAVDRFSPEDIAVMTAQVHQWRSDDLGIWSETLFDEPECRVWKMSSFSIPCGGTHVASTGLIPALEISRTNKGKDRQRMYYSLPALSIDHPTLQKMNATTEVI